MKVEIENMNDDEKLNGENTAEKKETDGEKTEKSEKKDKKEKSKKKSEKCEKVENQPRTVKLIN